MTEAKPFCISKKVVWRAWQRVKANQGAAGVDEESIAEFEANLRGNLYKLWNRMSWKVVRPYARWVLNAVLDSGFRRALRTQHKARILRRRLATFCPALQMLDQTQRR